MVARPVPLTGILLLAAILALASPAAGDQERDVRGYVQDLVDAAQPGDTVRIISGLYPENVRITKPLTLIGEGNVVIDGKDGKAVRIEGANVRLENLRLWSTVTPIEMRDAAWVELVHVDIEAEKAARAVHVGWVRVVAKPSAALAAPELDNSSVVHLHPLRVQVLSDSGGPRPEARCEITTDAGDASSFLTDAEGYLPTIDVAHEWASPHGSGTNQTYLTIRGHPEPNRFLLDSHAGTQRLGGPAAGSPWYQEPVLLVPVALVAAGGLWTALLLRFHEGLRWRWLLYFSALYTRFAKGEILEHDVRETIYGYVEQNPGAHLRGIKRDLGLKHGTLLHHLQMLEQHGFLKSSRDGMYRRFFVMGAAPRYQGAEQMARLVLALVKDRPGVTNLEIAQALSKRPSLVHYHVQRLEEQGRVRKERTGREARVYYVTGSGGAPPAA